MVVVRSGELGASIALSGFLTALLPIGKILADLPAGAIAARIGDRYSMILASAVGVVAAIVAAAASSVVMFAAGVLVLGMTDAVYQLSRQSYVAGAVHPLRRARALSTLGGVHRVGLFIGPFVAAALAPLAGGAGGFWAAVATSVVAGLVVSITRELPGQTHRRSSAPVPMKVVLTMYRRVWATMGVAV